jgi:hypothetical protein
MLNANSNNMHHFPHRLNSTVHQSVDANISNKVEKIATLLVMN